LELKVWSGGICFTNTSKPITNKPANLSEPAQNNAKKPSPPSRIALPDVHLKSPYFAETIA
jgi:hypothetical protein